MKIGILGAGAMGSLVGAHLMKGGAEVYFVDPYVKHMQAVEREGLHMELEEQEEETVKITMAVSDASKAGTCDLVILLVKGMNTKSSIEANRELFGEDTVVISLQNGLGNVDILKEFFPTGQIGYGVLKASATLRAPGRIAGRVKFPYSPKGVWFSPLEKDTPYRHLFEEMEKILERGGFPAALSEQTEAIMWDKLFINILYNAPCALVQLAGEDFMRHEEGRKLLKELAREVCEVASARGVPMDPEEYWKKERENMAQVPLNEHHFTSTVLDVFKQRKTEVEFLNGAVCREGKKYGIPTPYNEAVYYLLRVREDTYDLMFEG
ncbi:ketopantoate reductase family protein [Lactonifactor longoviformis]|uniref:ketopantoate reductase family protein n=1 Tax=Lactonifactor longoviformis TaxID=341220 RepID=UPI001D00E46B|nr:2-dehydropantoate 2-reductase [Lactonifactor longoviformis]MCB5713381.1 2-dehydropantoate 2-reductase [Lactonifactor longoviformis]MCB5716683.1 2-dehydropantoate 2-reductase [Lactonifactor longoviformis]